MISNKYTEEDKLLLYNYHLLAMENGWGLGFRHIRFNVSSDDIAACYNKSGFIPFYCVYGFINNKDCKITYTKTNTICHLLNNSTIITVPNTVIAKRISDYIFTYWCREDVDLALKLAKEFTLELLELSSSKNEHIKQNLEIVIIRDEQEKRRQEKERKIKEQETFKKEEERIRQEEKKRRDDEEKQREEEEKQRQEEEKRREEKEKRERLVSILMEYEYNFKGISKICINWFRCNFKGSFYWRPWFKVIMNNVDKKKDLSDQKKMAFIYAHAFMYKLIDFESNYNNIKDISERVYYKNVFDTVIKEAEYHVNRLYKKMENNNNNMLSEQIRKEAELYHQKLVYERMKEEKFLNKCVNCNSRQKFLKYDTCCRGCCAGFHTKECDCRNDIIVHN